MKAIQDTRCGSTVLPSKDEVTLSGAGEAEAAAAGADASPARQMNCD